MSGNFTVNSPDPREKKRYYIEMTALRWFITESVRAIFHLISTRQVSGVENLPESGPVVLAANHMTNFDVFPMQFALPRPIFFMGKEELFRNPALDYVLRQLGGFPVYRGAGDEWAIRHAEKVLARGQVLGIFPEGKRNKGSGLRPAKTGAARLAIGAGCPVVPMAVHGTQYMLHRFPTRTPLTLKVGAPLYPLPEEDPVELTERIMLSLAEMLPPESRGEYRKRLSSEPAFQK
jgi:1-acyl-sn-glycerol-3-phosphate acyltransferase